MLYLAIIFHMHQPYYKNLLTNETDMPWVRLHGIKDYLDMVLILEKHPKMQLVFNLVPSLIEQVEDYVNYNIKDYFLDLSYKPAAKLTQQEKEFILNRFFSINPDKCIAAHPRYYELYFKKKTKKEFTTQDFLDLQTWFTLAWYDPTFRKNMPEIHKIVAKGRFFTEEDKRVVLDKQVDILKEIIPTYKKFIKTGQIEATISPYCHPILPLLCNTKIAKEANIKTVLPHTQFIHPEDAAAQINEAVEFYKSRFGAAPQGMWPSEEAVSEHILPYIIKSGIKWIVSDEAILFKSLKAKRRNSRLLYQPHLLKRDEGDLNIVFRDRNLSDLMGFVYHRWGAESAVEDFMKHMHNISVSFKQKDILITIAMDGENAWEYYSNDGHDFLNLLYQRLSETEYIKTTTVGEYLEKFPATNEIEHLAAGSWIYGEFGKWIGSALKIRAWEYLAAAHEEFERSKKNLPPDKLTLAWKQMRVLEGSDWFWWYGDDDTGDFDKLYRMHLGNFYTIIGTEIPDYVKHPIV